MKNLTIVVLITELAKQLRIPQKLLPKVLQDSNELLQSIYGMEIVDITEIKSSKSFIIVPKMKLLTGLMLTSEAAADLKTLFIVLSYIFMKSGEVQEGNLVNLVCKLPTNSWKFVLFFLTVNLITFIEKLNYNLEEFGKTKEKFVRQLYLKRRKQEIEGKNEVLVYYSWGERAQLEFDKKEILENVAQLVKKPSSNFVPQHQQVFGDDLQDSIMIE